MASSAGETLLAIDLGTSGVKVGLFDRGGALRRRASRSHGLAVPRAGWAEQSPEAWWQGVRECLAELVPDLAGGFAGACVVGQGPTLVGLDTAGDATGPALLWGDGRATVEADALAERTGARVFPSFNLPKVMWLRQHEPERFARTTTFLQSFEFVNFRLTGECSAVSAVPPWAPWDEGQIKAAGLDRGLFPSRLCRLGETVGSISARCSAETGLPAGRPVFAGLVDGLAAWIGTATLEPGELFAGSGTTAGANVCWSEALRDPDERVGSLPHPLGRRFMVGGPMSTGSGFLDWLARDVCREDVATLAAEAGGVAAGAEGLVALPYLFGERTPIQDSRARGVFCGLSSGHTRAHLARAAMEAVAFAVRDVADVAEQAGATISVVRTGGGGAASPVWNQIKADVLGRPVLVPQVRDASLMGAAVVAASGAGLYESAEAAARAMVRVDRVYEPGESERYAALFDLYRKLYRDLRGDFDALAKIRGAA